LRKILNLLEILKDACRGLLPIVFSFTAIILGSIYYFTWHYIGNGPHRLKFLLTANVEVDGKPKSGSSVIEVLYDKPFIGGFGANSIVGARGTMPIVDLGEGKIIVLSFYNSGDSVIPSNISDFSEFKKCRTSHPKYLPTMVMLENKGLGGVPKIIRRLREFPIGEKVTFKYQSMSVHIIRSSNPEEYRQQYNFCSLRNVLGERYVPKSITIERTEAPLEFKIDPAPAWLLQWRKPCIPNKRPERYSHLSYESKVRRGVKRDCPSVGSIETENYRT